MPGIVRGILAIVVGLIVGSMVNMAIVMLGPAIIPPPDGVDVTNPENLAAAMHLFEPKHFVAPFLAHALGTLVGAFAAYLIAARHKPRFAYAIGVIFLCGGVAASLMLPAPIWFIALDLVVAYLPMAWLAVLLGRRVSGASAG